MLNVTGRWVDRDRLIIPSFDRLVGRKACGCGNEVGFVGKSMHQ
jgi:hypothetical protein